MKKLVKILVMTAMLFGIGISGLAAQGLENKNAIGVYILGASNPIGGIQYERQFSKIFSMKYDSYIYYANDTTEPLFYNLNAEFCFNLFESEWKEDSGSRLYAFGLIGHSGKMIADTVYDTSKGEYVNATPVFHSNMILAAGFGFDFIFFNHLSIPFQFGYMGNFPYEPSAGFCAGTGLRYSF